MVFRWCPLSSALRRGSRFATCVDALILEYTTRARDESRESGVGAHHLSFHLVSVETLCQVHRILAGTIVGAGRGVCSWYPCDDCAADRRMECHDCTADTSSVRLRYASASRASAAAPTVQPSTATATWLATLLCLCGATTVRAAGHCSMAGFVAGHLSALSAKRQVLLYETRGQGGAFATGNQADLSDCTLPRHAEDFVSILNAAGLRDKGPCDVVAFSFGARVAMCAAASGDASLIRRLCVSGTTSDRGSRGRLALQSWRSSLRSGDLEGFVWRLILDTYSPYTLGSSEAQVPKWVANVVAANDVAGLQAIVEQTHSEDPDDSTHPLAMAKAIRASQAVEAGLLINGAEDLLCAPGAGQALADAAGWRYVEIENAAHACPIEQPTKWRKAALEFLDAD